MLRFRTPLIVCCLLAFIGCSSSQSSHGENSLMEKNNVSFLITSSSFPDGAAIPKKFTCDGENISPQLSWTTVPNGTKSLALITEDPDAPAGTWTHWVLFDLPGDARQLPEGVAPSNELPDGAKQGKNDFGKIGYGGPCPPPGKAHRYFFKLYALSSDPEVQAGASKQHLLHAMEGYILAQTEIVGTYQRQ